MDARYWDIIKYIHIPVGKTTTTSHKTLILISKKPIYIYIHTYITKLLLGWAIFGFQCTLIIMKKKTIEVKIKKNVGKK